MSATPTMPPTYGTTWRMWNTSASADRDARQEHARAWIRGDLDARHEVERVGQAVVEVYATAEATGAEVTDEARVAEAPAEVELVLHRVRLRRGGDPSGGDSAASANERPRRSACMRREV